MSDSSANGKGKGTLKDERFVVRVKRAEKRKFEKLAKLRNTDLSELTRQVLHREADTNTVKAGA